MDSPISALPQVGNPTVNDFIPIVQGGITSKMTVGQFQQGLPISAAEAAALAAKAPLANPNFAGTVSAGTLNSVQGYFQGNTNVNDAYALLFHDGSSTYLHSSYSATAGAKPIKFSIGGSINVLSTLLPNGNLLIGTTSDTGEKLQVAGNLSLKAPSAVAGAYQSIGFPAGVYGKCQIRGYSTGTTDAGELAFLTCPAGDVLTERGRFDSSGNLLVGVASGSNHMIRKATAAGNLLLSVDNNSITTASFFGADVAGWNGAATALQVAKNNTTGRSVNAGGTLNASGADYAEYMPKADTCGIVEKGAVIGIDSNGKLIDKWADALSFAVKSTNPSYVGGDVWGSEEALGANRPVGPVFEAPDYTGCQPPLEEAPAEEATDEEKAAYAAAMAQYTADQQAHSDAVTAAQQQFDTVTIPAYESSLASFEALLETARQKVDRIAFCGQVPVNVLGATPGQYIIPVQDGDGIKGIAVTNPSFEQYMIAVGKVIAIEADGRARIIVKPV